MEVIIFSSLRHHFIGAPMNENDDDKLIVPLIETDPPPMPHLVEVTTYIREDQASALAMIRLAEQQSRGTPCDQAELFQEALDMLIKTRLIGIDKRKKMILK
jgi:hypothetical protein